MGRSHSQPGRPARRVLSSLQHHRQRAGSRIPPAPGGCATGSSRTNQGSLTAGSAGSISTTASQTHGLAPADRPDVLAGLGLDVDVHLADAHQPSEVGANGRLVGTQLGLLGVDDHVAIDNSPAALTEPVRPPPPAARCYPCPASGDRCPGNARRYRPDRRPPGVRRPPRDKRRRRRSDPPIPADTSIVRPPRINGRPSSNRWVSWPIPTRSLVMGHWIAGKKCRMHGGSRRSKRLCLIPCPESRADPSTLYRSRTNDHQRSVLPST